MFKQGEWVWIPMNGGWSYGKLLRSDKQGYLVHIEGDPNRMKRFQPGTNLPPYKFIGFRAHQAVRYQLGGAWQQGTIERPLDPECQSWIVRTNGDPLHGRVVKHGDIRHM